MVQDKGEGYFSKMKGTGKSPERVGWFEVAISWIGAFLGISIVSYLNYNVLNKTDLVMMIGSFGASAVLIYGAVKSPLAQPRNFVGGHIVSALVGVSFYKLISQPWLASSLAVATAIAVMHLTKTLHPPGGATALIAVIGSDNIHALGYMYVITPVALGAIILLVVSLIVNNIPNGRRYPVFWW
ncbi:HPP family protein [Candidatus Bathyarchaeota archaeon]|nr:HPP family protein [Candidatus Bathyarchaeota archaeon]